MGGAREALAIQLEKNFADVSLAWIKLILGMSGHYHDLKEKDSLDGGAKCAADAGKMQAISPHLRQNNETLLRAYIGHLRDKGESGELKRCVRDLVKVRMSAGVESVEILAALFHFIEAVHRYVRTMPRRVQ